MSAYINRYIDPLTRFGFRQLFGNTLNKKILIKFLEAVFEGKKELASISFLPNADDLSDDKAERAEKADKEIFRFLCTEKRGKQFNLIIYRIEENEFRYSADKFVSLLFKNPSFPLVEHYLLGLLSFSLEAYKDLYYRDISFTNFDMERNPRGKLNFKFLEIPGFSKCESQLESNLDKWFYALKHLHHLEQVPESCRGEIFQQLFQQMEVSVLNEEQDLAYAAEIELINKQDAEFKIYNPEKAAEQAADLQIHDGNLNTEKKYHFLDVFKLGYEHGFEDGMLEISNEIGKEDAC